MSSDYDKGTQVTRREALEHAEPKFKTQYEAIIYYCSVYIFYHKNGPTYIDLWEFMILHGIDYWPREKMYLVSSRLSDLRKKGYISSLAKEGKGQSINTVSIQGRDHYQITVAQINEGVVLTKKLLNNKITHEIPTCQVCRKFKIINPNKAGRSYHAYITEEIVTRINNKFKYSRSNRKVSKTSLLKEKISLLEKNRFEIIETDETRGVTKKGVNFRYYTIHYWSVKDE